MKVRVPVITKEERFVLEHDVFFPGHIPPMVGDYICIKGDLKLQISKRIFENTTCRLEAFLARGKKAGSGKSLVDQLVDHGWEIIEREPLGE